MAENSPQESDLGKARRSRGALIGFSNMKTGTFIYINNHSAWTCVYAYKHLYI